MVYSDAWRIFFTLLLFISFFSEGLKTAVASEEELSGLKL